MQRSAKILAIILTSSFLTAAAVGAEETSLKIAAAAGKSVCESTVRQLGETSQKIELCVSQGNFAHDVYVLKIDGKSILKGIDDETTKGIVATQQGEKISLICVPQIEAPTEVAPEKIEAMQKLMPALSADEAKKAAISIDSVETGRLCTAQRGDNSLISVQVVFN
ncbi:hypothetical protein [Collimonas humicola]|uniref:hypothetical protein n=1 Tax=Collimonas humicola TaxID=2825886 RepID=UPI001B8D5942|nr:hypothetical protein [Collimonas humicola]